jgi:hypothetical protein
MLTASQSGSLRPGAVAVGSGLWLAATQTAERKRVPIAVTGSWVKDGRRFSITSDDLQDIVQNFKKRKNGRVVIDYEHASEQPRVAAGKAVPAAGWLYDTEIEGGTLYGDVGWNKEAHDLIANGEYQYLSPAIDWGACDKESGEPQGATLTSIGLTNHPFLEELPALMAAETKARLWPGTVLLMSEKAELADVDPEKVIQVPVPQDGNMKIKVKVQRKEGDTDDKEKMRDNEGALSEAELADLHGVLMDDDKGADYKEGVHKSDYGFVGDPDDKSTWKYKLDTPGRARNALARWGQHKGIPKDKEPGVLRKIMKRAKDFGVEVDKDNPKYKIAASDSARFGLSELFDDISDDEKRTHLQAEVNEYFGTGSGSPFSCGSPWIRDVFPDYVIVAMGMKFFKIPYSVDDDGDYKLGKLQEVTQQWVAASEVKTMKASELAGLKKRIVLVEDDSFVFRAPDGKFYRRGYAKDGEVITLSETVQLADKKGLPADVQDREANLSDDDGVADGVKDDKDMQKELHKKAKSQAEGSQDGSEDDQDDAVLRDKAKVAAADDDKDKKPAAKLPRFRMRAMREKDGVGKEGQHAVIDGDGKLCGYVTHGDFMDHAGKYRDAGDKKAMSELLSEAILDATGRPLSINDVKKAVVFYADNGDAVEAQEKRRQATKVMLTEAFDNTGELDKRKMRHLLADGRIDMKDFAVLEDAVEDVDKLIARGRFLPAQRKGLIRIYLGDKVAFDELVANQPNVIDFSTRGFSTTGEADSVSLTGNPDQEIMKRAKGLQDKAAEKGQKLSFADARLQVLASDVDLSRRYNEAHRKTM